MVIHGVLTEPLGIHAGVRPGITIKRFDDVNRQAQSIRTPDDNCQAQGVAVVDQGIPVLSDAGFSGKAVRPLRITAGARLNFDSPSSGCEHKQRTVSSGSVQVLFFRHDFVLAAIAADFEGGGVTGFVDGVRMYSYRDLVFGRMLRLRNS